MPIPAPKPFNDTGRRDITLQATLEVEVLNASGLHMEIEDALSGIRITDEDDETTAIIRRVEVAR